MENNGNMIFVAQDGITGSLFWNVLNSKHELKLAPDHEIVIVHHKIVMGPTRWWQCLLSTLRGTTNEVWNEQTLKNNWDIWQLWSFFVNMNFFICYIVWLLKVSKTWSVTFVTWRYFCRLFQSLSDVFDVFFLNIRRTTVRMWYSFVSFTIIHHNSV